MDTPHAKQLNKELRHNIKELICSPFRRSKADKNDPYGLMQTIKVTDVKGYLQKEFERAEEREAFIEEQFERIKKLEAINVKYEALLVVQDKTQKRIERLDATIKKLREDLEKSKTTEKALRAKIVDIKANAERKLGELKAKKGKK